jgi:hypothetical protein
MGIFDAPLRQELMRLDDRGDLALLHGFFELFPCLIGDQLFRTTLTYPTDQQLIQATFSVRSKPSLALTPAIAQSLSRFSQIATLFGLQKSEHLHPVEQVAITMAFFEPFEFFLAFLDYLWIVDVWHEHIMSLMSWIGIRGIFAVCYKQDRKGRLFNFREGTDTKYRFEFPESGETITTDELSDIDDKLLAIFMKRVEELG